VKLPKVRTEASSFQPCILSAGDSRSYMLMSAIPMCLSVCPAARRNIIFKENCQGGNIHIWKYFSVTSGNFLWSILDWPQVSFSSLKSYSKCPGPRYIYSAHGNSLQISYSQQEMEERETQWWKGLVAVITYTALSDGEASAQRHANVEEEKKKGIESNGDFKVNW